MHDLAQNLNTVIANDCPCIDGLFSKRGKQIFFPKTGILGQTAQAKGSRYNATIGIALDDDGTPMRLSSIDSMTTLPAKEVFPYTSSYGLSQLRTLWQQMQREKNPDMGDDVTLPVVTSGLTGALSVAGYLFLDEGQDLLVSDHYWGNYNLIFGVTYGARIKPFSTFSGNGLDLDALRHAVSGPEKNVLALNFPNNPTGYTPIEQEAKEIVSILTDAAEQSEGIVVLLDDAYFGLVYEDGVYTQSLFAQLSCAHENLLAIKIDGATKEDYVWGHRVGFITFGMKGMTSAVKEALEAKASGAVRALVSNACHLSQSQLVHAYQSPQYQSDKGERYETLRARYEEMKRVLADPKFETLLTPLPFNSGYFMCIELAEGIDAEVVRTTLLEQYGVGLIAKGRLLRIAYSCLPVSDIEPVFCALYETCVSLSTLSHEPSLASV